MELFIPPDADPEPSPCPVRRFTLLDAMVLIGATAAGLGSIESLGRRIPTSGI